MKYETISGVASVCSLVDVLVRPGGLHVAEQLLERFVIVRRDLQRRPDGADAEAEAGAVVRLRAVLRLGACDGVGPA